MKCVSQILFKKKIKNFKKVGHESSSFDKWSIWIIIINKYWFPYLVEHFKDAPESSGPPCGRGGGNLISQLELQYILQYTNKITKKIYKKKGKT